MVETYLVNFGTVSKVGVEPYSQYRKSDFQFKFEVSPETYVVVMKTDAPLPGNRESYHKSKLKSKKKLSNEAKDLPGDADAGLMGMAIQIMNRLSGSKRCPRIVQGGSQ